jgi:hypothetical protein
MSTRPGDGAGGGAAAMRGFLLIGVGVLIGAALLINSYGGGSSGPLDTSSNKTSGTGRGATSTTVRGGGATSTTLTPVSHPPAEVKVLVLNGSGKAGVAKAGADALKPAGFTTLDPTNAKSTVATSVVYAAAGFEADAIAVAGLLGLPPTVVKPLTAPPPAEVGDPADAAVVAVRGPDSAAAGGAAATTTTAAPAAN